MKILCSYTNSGFVWSMLALLMACSINISCNASKKTKGAVIGATVGGVTGAIITKKNKAAGIVIGAAIGGVAGALIGNYMDKQAEQIRKDLEGAKVERLEEGIVITFDSGLLFDFDSYSLRNTTKNNLSRLANTLQKYDTDVMILGHTDDVGNEEYNLNLSNQRANAVNQYLVNQSIRAGRIVPQGLGENDPLFSNDSESNRQKNRRVELTIVATKKLIRDAKRGKIPGA